LSEQTEFPSAPVDVGAVGADLHGPLLGFVLAQVVIATLRRICSRDVMLRAHRHVDEVERMAAVDARAQQIARNARGSIQARGRAPRAALRH
jgi:hypothetical protein